MLAVTFDDSLEEGDLTIVDEAALEGEGIGDLETLAILSVYCDAPAQPGDPVDPSAPRSGYWADAYDDGDRWGSRLWTLSRSKLTQETARKAKSLISEALAWMVADGIASKVEVETTIKRLPGRDANERAVVTTIDVYGPNGSLLRSFGPWEALRGV